jgi:hypothetical protein
VTEYEVNALLDAHDVLVRATQLEDDPGMSFLRDTRVMAMLY